jgi:hypothetical protein
MAEMKIGDRVTLLNDGGYTGVDGVFPGAVGFVTDVRGGQFVDVLVEGNDKPWPFLIGSEVVLYSPPVAKPAERKVVLNIDLDTDPDGEADTYDNVTRIRITRVLTLQEGRDFIKAISPIMKSSIVG